MGSGGVSFSHWLILLKHAEQSWEKKKKKTAGWQEVKKTPHISFSKFFHFRHFNGHPSSISPSSTLCSLHSWQCSDFPREMWGPAEPLAGENEAPGCSVERVFKRTTEGARKGKKMAAEIALSVLDHLESNLILVSSWRGGGGGGGGREEKETARQWGAKRERNKNKVKCFN